jgi:hypothetical protein
VTHPLCIRKTNLTFETPLLSAKSAIGSKNASAPSGLTVFAQISVGLGSVVTFDQKNFCGGSLHRNSMAGAIEKSAGGFPGETSRSRDASNYAAPVRCYKIIKQ